MPIGGDYYNRAVAGSEMVIDWRAVRMAWLMVLPFLILFLINNYLLVPYLMFRKKYVSYTISLLVVIVLLFGIFPCFARPPYGNRFKQVGPPPVEMEKRREVREKAEHRLLDGFGLPAPHPLQVPVFVRMTVAVLLVGFNIAIKLMFKSLRDEQRLKELEHKRLQSELEYLKYQINPHFFMNTLNNIHALVDIDAAKAKKALVELSKLMRYVLYETGNQTILLSREIQFLDNYVELMRLRYINKVEVEVTLPEDIPEVQIPPLLFVSFVENAFKHGVSYRKDSFIRLSVELDGDKLRFCCRNSNRKKEDESCHGIGLENIRKRLRLLFGNDYTLSIDETDECFSVLLIIPFL